MCIKLPLLRKRHDGSPDIGAQGWDVGELFNSNGGSKFLCLVCIEKTYQKWFVIGYLDQLILGFVEIFFLLPTCCVTSEEKGEQW